MQYRAIREEELSRAAEVQARGFRWDPERARDAYHDSPRVEWRGVRVVENDEGRFVASLATFERNVSLNGGELAAGLVARVGVPPEERRRGYANVLMAGLLEEYYERKLPISLLYPFSIGFYRRLGYGLGNYNYFYEIPPRYIPDFSERLDVLRVTVDDAPNIRRCYERARLLPGCNGRLSRTEWEWQERFWKDEHEVVIYPDEEDGIAGYLVYERIDADDGMRAKIVEWVHTNDAAWRGLAGFLRALGDQVRAINYNAPQDDPLLYTLTEPYSVDGGRAEFVFRHVARLVSGFMLRVVHLPTALRRRRYPQHVTTRFSLRVTDEQLPSNASPLRVRIANGSAEVTSADDADRAGQSSTVDTDVVTFSEVYAGVVTAEQARTAGRLRADDATCADVTEVFAAAPLYMHQTDWF